MIMRLMGAAMLAASFCFLHGCGKNEEVNVFMYSEYIDPAIVESFEKETGIKVRINTYENSEDMQAKVQRGGGDSQFDVLVVSDVQVPALVTLKLVQPIDMNAVPNAQYVDPQFIKAPYDPEGKFTLPYQWGTVGLIFNKEVIKPEDVSWAAIFDRNQAAGKFILMDSMRDMIGIALKYQGKSMNTKDAKELEAATDLLLAAKKSPNFLAFESGVAGKNRVIANEAVAAIVYNGDAVRDMGKNAAIDFAVPKEGGVIWTDVMMVTSKTKNAANAHKFINYILQPKISAALSNFNRYPTPNREALPMIDKVDLTNPRVYPSKETMQKLDYLTDVGEATGLYDKAWTTLKAR